MAHRTGKNRLEFCFFATPLDEIIAPDNAVRVIDAFVDAIDLGKLGFSHVIADKLGAPPYHPGLLLKIYIYGYLNRIRSSRRLEIECCRNIELFWLTSYQQPSYHTISDFRSIKPHRKALKETFRLFNKLLHDAGLFGNELVAIDGTKVRAQNSKKNNISEDKINKRLDYHESRFMEYLDELDRADDAIGRDEAPVVDPETSNKVLDEIQQRTEKLESLLGALKDAQQEDPTIRQISLIDPEARSMPINNLGHTDIVYNLQSAVEEKHHLIAHFSVENISDIHLLSQTAIATKTELAVDIYEDALVNNRIRVLNNRDKYKRRQVIVEHPYGTIIRLRRRGYYYTLLKGKEKVSGEFSLVFLAYNLRRAVSILGVTGLLAWINVAFWAVLALWRQVARQRQYFFIENSCRLWRCGVVQAAG